MTNLSKFIDTISNGYQTAGESILLGGAIFQGTIQNNLPVGIPTKMMNRHGLIAGATGTGKTKTLQVIAEQLSQQGVPSLMMDIKGDLSGIAAAGANIPALIERNDKIGLPFQPRSYPTEFLSISEEPGARMRATLSEFGPILFAKILELNDTQEGVLSVIFKYCDDHKLPLVNLEDLKAVINYATGAGKEEFSEQYGSISTATIGTILRKIIALEQQGATRFFGEISFEVADLCQTDTAGNGVISIVRLTDIQDKPSLFSTFMLQLLAEIYATFPEEGDGSKPKLVLFIDEAHLIFQEASKALLNQLNTIVKLIRSKGVGLIFVTQSPADLSLIHISEPTRPY